MFKKKEKVLVNIVGLTLYHKMEEFIFIVVDDLITQEEFVVLKNDKGKLIIELLILSFWNLMFLKCPIKLYKATLDAFLAARNLNEDGRKVLFQQIESRSNEYDNAWQKGPEIFLSTLAKNIHKDFALNAFLWTYLMNIHKALTDANKIVLSGIKDKIDIVQA